MRQRAGGHLRPFLLLGKRDDRQRVRVFRVRDFRDALHLLRPSLTDPFEMDGIRRWWTAQGGLPHRDDSAILADIARAESEGRIAFADPVPWRPVARPGDPARQRSDRGTPVREPRQRPAAPPRGRDRPDVPTKPEEPVKTWIEFRLFDDDDKQPVAGVPFRITLTDGSEVTKSTDGSGKIRIDDIDPGSCGIREITIDEAPEVTQVKGA